LVTAAFADRALLNRWLLMTALDDFAVWMLQALTAS